MHISGTRYNIIDAGGLEGFVPGARYIEVNAHWGCDEIEKWFREKLIPGLRPNKNLVILDNARTHGRFVEEIPTSRNRVGEIKEFLKNKSIHFPENATKPTLLKLVQKYGENRALYIDELLKSAEHEVFRLPPYHCHLNPIGEYNYFNKEYLMSLYLFKNLFWLK